MPQGLQQEWQHGVVSIQFASLGVDTAQCKVQANEELSCDHERVPTLELNRHYKGARRSTLGLAVLS